MAAIGEYKGITRRASASSSQVVPSAATSTTRVHKGTSESHHGFVGQHPTHPGPGQYIPSTSSGSPQDKVVLALIKRLTSKLPCYSGLSLTDIESDDAVLLIIDSLVELARHALDIIVWKLLEELEKLAKQNDVVGSRTICLLQSEVFLLKVLSVTLAYRWQHRNPPTKTSQTPLDGTSSNGHTANGSATNTQTNSPVPSPSVASQPKPPPSSKRPRPGSRSIDQLSNASLWLDAHPLDENCALWLVSVMTLLLRQAAPRDDRTKAYANLSTDATLYGFETIDRDDSWSRAEPAPWSPPSSNDAPEPSRWPRKTPSLTSMSSNATAPIPLPRSALGFRSTPRTLITSSLPLHNLVGQWAGHIVYLLSAVNWAVVMNRIKTKIHSLARATPMEENLDSTDLMLLQHCAMDRKRLVQVLSELSSLGVNMKRDAQAAVAVSLRRAIWNWMETFPHEYLEVMQGTRKLDGAPERVFDMLFVNTDESNKRTMWPTLTALMMLSHDRSKQLAMSYARERTKSLKKESLLVDQMQKNLVATSKLTDVSLMCFIDVCRAASRAPPHNDLVLHSIATEIADEIKGRLWKASNQRPFYESSDPIDVALYADALVALYRFLPEEESVHLFSTCLEPDRSEAVKMCAVKACIILQQEAERWTWQSSPIALWSKIGIRIRRILRVAATRRPEIDQNGTMKRPASKPVSKRYTSETIADRDMLVLAILALYRIDARCFLFESEAKELDDWVTDTVQLVQKPGDPAVPLSALRTFIHAAHWVNGLSQGDEFYEHGRVWMSLAIPGVLLSAATRLLDARNDFEEQRICIEMSYGIVQLYAKCIESEVANNWDIVSGRLPAMAVAEIAFLVSLTSADNAVSTFAAKALREIALAEGSPAARKNGAINEERAKRFSIYEQLGDPTVVTIGRVGHQKRVRKLLKALDSPSPISCAVWQECFWRWSALKEAVIRRSLDLVSTDGQNGFKPVGDRTMSPEECMYQWQNLTLFLAAFGASATLDQYSNKDLLSIIPAKYLPDRFRAPQDGEEMVQNLIVASVDFLIADSPHAREIVKEALGSELSPKLYSFLFKQLHAVIDDLTKTANVLDDGNFGTEEFMLTFFEQFLAVLKLLVDRVDSPSEEVVGNMELNQTLLSLTKFMDRFNERSYLRVKVKFCSFCENALARADVFGLRKDDVVRNNLVEVVADWIEPEVYPMEEYEEGLGIARMQHDANMACLRTVVKLLEGLRLQALDGSTGDDANHVVSRRFNRYQTLLLAALKHWQFDNVVDDELAVQLPNRKSAAEVDAEIRDHVINGLTYLLSSNSDIGLKHFLPLGYDTDAGIRGIFCHVVARVMETGAKFETSNDTITAGKRMRISELLKGSDVSGPLEPERRSLILEKMILVLIVCETCPPAEVDIIIPVLLNIFDTRSSLLSLLKLLIEQEVRSTPNESGLFRGNSMRMRLLCAFAKLHGYDYLRQLVKPLLDKMCVLTVGNSFILDSQTASEEDIADNQETIKFFTQAFLTIVCNSAPGMPLMIREICAHISQTVSDVWPEAKFAALGAFIFLRFISPALVSPSTIDIELPQDNAAIRRGLLVIAKIIQNLANNVRFGKEAHMIYFNDFLEVNIVRVMRFLTDVNKFATATVEEEPDEWFGGTFDDTDAIVLQRFFEKHAEKVGRELLGLGKSSKDGDATVIGGKKAWDKLCAALVQMNQPVDVPQLSTKTSSENQDYREFMTRNNDRSAESVREIFRAIGITTDNRALFLLSVSKFDVEVLDFELLVYHIFSTLTAPAYDGKKFDVIMDCTTYTPSSEVPMQWFKFFLELIPVDIRQRLGTARLLNSNLAILRFLRKLYVICAGSFNIDIQTYFSVQELCDALNENITGFLQETWSLEQESKEVFRDVMLRQAHLMKIPVHVEVAQSHIRVNSVKASNFYPNFFSKSSEYIPYSDVGDIYNVSTGRDANEFIIRRGRNGGTLYFSSADREVIVKAIRIAKSRMSHGRTVFFDRFSRQSNMSAALLNIAMFNTIHDDAYLRSAAYRLLQAVCLSLNYEGELFLPSTGGYISGHPVTFVIRLSERLAAYAPQLTLDFISQVCVELDKCNVYQKAIRLQYMNPWIRNLTKFCNPTSKLYELSGARLRDCIRGFIDLTVRDNEVYYIMQKYTWAEVGKLDSTVVNIALDEVMRSAVDGGMGSPRCEMMAETLGSLASISARGRILAKLRKILGKTSMKPSKTLERNVHWNEIAAYTRLVYGSGLVSHQLIQNELFVPEVIHLVTLLAAQGDTDVRLTVYGVTLQLFQSLHTIHSEDVAIAGGIRTLLEELTSPETLRYFGLTLLSATTNEYAALDISDDLVTSEGLSRWLLRALSICSGNTGLTNVWRSRWMSLLTATAFQLSPCIQPRAFIVLGTLASSDVDDDLLYQMLVALKSAMQRADESDTLCIVSMLHCICNVVPVLPSNSRYLGPLFWLAVALLQSSHAAFYKEANSLLCACLTTLHRQGALREKGFTTALLDARNALEDISIQLDQILNVAFDSDFSFSLAAVIFKGIRRSQLRDSAVEALRCLLTTAVASSEPVSRMGAADVTVHPETLGYFLALLSVSTTPHAYRQLLEEAGVGSSWIPSKDSVSRSEDDDDQVPRVPFDILGVSDPNTALLAISFVGTMLTTAQGDDAESQILFSLLSDASSSYSEIVSLLYEGLQEKIHDTFANSSNPAILASVSTVFRIAMEDASRNVALRGSSSTLGTLDEDSAYVPGQRHILALEELNMQGLATTFQFLPPNGGHVTTVLKWFPELIAKIIE